MRKIKRNVQLALKDRARNYLVTPTENPAGSRML